MIFLNKAKIPGHLEDHIMQRTSGSRLFSEIHAAIRILARRPTSGQAGTYYEDDYDIDEQEEEEPDEPYDEEDLASDDDVFLDYDLSLIHI